MSNLREPVFYDRFVDLVRRFGCGTFVETGTGPDPGALGVAQAWELDSYSCDVSEKTIANAHEKYPRAHLYQLDSLDFLKFVLPNLDATPTVFWLDAHFGYFEEYGGVEGHANWPVFEELGLIKSLKGGYERDVILCDDIFCIVDPENPRYVPSEMDHSRLAQREHAWSEYIGLLSETHDTAVFGEFEGVLCFHPRR